MARCPWNGEECTCSSSGHGWPFGENGKPPKRCQDNLTFIRSCVRACKAKTKRVSDLNSYAGRPCPYCGVKMTKTSSKRKHSVTRDHVVPRSKGATFSLSWNRAVVCRTCNTDKDDMSLGQFYCMLVATEDPRAEHVFQFMANLRKYAPKDFVARTVDAAANNQSMETA